MAAEGKGEWEMECRVRGDDAPQIWLTFTRDASDAGAPSNPLLATPNSATTLKIFSIKR